MDRQRIRSFLGLLLLTVPALAALPADGRSSSSPAPVAAVYSITFRGTQAAPVPAGVTLTCKARIVPSLPLGAGINALPAAAGEVGRPSGSGSTAACSLEIPFSWYAEPAQSSPTLSYEVDAVSASGATVQVLRGEGIVIPYSEQGTLAHVSVTIGF